MFKLRDERLFGPDLYSSESEWFSLELDLDKLLKSRAAQDVLAKLAAVPPEIEDQGEPADALIVLFTSKLTQSRKKIEGLRDLIAVRTALHSESLTQIDYQISKAALSLDEFRLFGVGYNTGVDMKRNHVERQLALFRRERRETRLRTWQDLAGLRRELDEAFAQYRELMRRYRLADYKG